MTAGCFRHCRRDNPHRGAAGWAYAYFWRLWIWNRNFQLLGSCVSDIGRWFLSRNLTNWRQPVAHAQPFRGQFRCCQQPAAVLCWPLCDPRLSSGRRGVEGCGRVFPALWVRPRCPLSRCQAIHMVIARSHRGAAGTAKMTAMTANRRATDSPLMPRAAPRRILMRCREPNPGRPARSRHTMHSPTSCASHDVGQGVIGRQV